MVYLTRIKKLNNINNIASELELVKQMSDSEVDLLQWESLVTINEHSDHSVVVCSSVVNRSVHSVVTTPSDLPSVVVCSVESSEVL